MSRTRIYAGAAVAAGLLIPSALWAPGFFGAPSARRAPAPELRASMVPAAPVPIPPPPFLDEPLTTASIPTSAGSAKPMVLAPEPPQAPVDPLLAALRSYAQDASLGPLAVDQLPLVIEADAVRAAVAAYRRGDMAAGDAAARTVSDSTARLALEWAAIKLQPRPAGIERLRAFLKRRPDWPSADWIEKQIEVALYADRKSAAEALAAFRSAEPETPFGALALARAETAEGKSAKAADRVRKIWREEDLTPSMEEAVLKEFGAVLTKADHKARSDRFYYDEKDAAALRAAQLAGPDVLKLLQARDAVASPRAAALIAALPKELQQDPSLIFAKAQAARRAEKFDEAASLLESAPSSVEALVDGDAWWTERRLVARKLLDLGDAARAYRIAAGHGAQSARWRIEAEFHAGWIALRHQDGSAERALVAKAHFDRAAAVAATPASKARAAYWQGRAAEALGDDRSARAAFSLAATRITTYYGQLARARLGLDEGRLAQAAPMAAPSDFTRVFRLLYSVGERALALPLAIDAARVGDRDAELASLSLWLAERRDAAAALAIGKTAQARGGALEETAFPTFGVPDYAPAPYSADKALVLSIARQESAFRADAVSHAGAKGLMQMLTSTARETAKRAGWPFDERRLLADPAFNAQLGAAHLGELLAAQQGSYILTFAAYNAGPGRAKQWIAAYGDPRDPNVDPIDWVERIPFSETREYVQKILENLQIYRMRLGARSGAGIEADLRRVRRAAMLTP